MNDILTEEEVAQILGCEIQTVQEKARAGELPGVKFGRPWRFPRTALLESLHAKAMANKPTQTAAPTAVIRKKVAIVRRPPTLPQLPQQH